MAKIGKGENRQKAPIKRAFGNRKSRADDFLSFLIERADAAEKTVRPPDLESAKVKTIVAADR